MADRLVILFSGLYRWTRKDGRWSLQPMRAGDPDMPESVTPNLFPGVISPGPCAAWNYENTLRLAEARGVKLDG